MTAETATTYSMEDSFPIQQQRTRGHRRSLSSSSAMSNGAAEADDNGSLTYSAGSSGGESSAAGESTDSSIGEILRVLDLEHDNGGNKELQELIREGVDPRKFVKCKQTHQQLSMRDERSVSSLAYSTDGEPALTGGEVVVGLQTISGQPSDSYGPDGGSDNWKSKSCNSDLVVASAAPASAAPVGSPSRKGLTKRNSSSLSNSSHDRKTILERSAVLVQNGAGTPPPAPRYLTKAHPDDDAIWYAKWWMCGFTDALQDLVPKSP